MELAYNGINPPEQWEHDPEIQNEWGYTTAMELANNGIIPSK